MRLTVLQENLSPKLSAVARIVSSRSALPVLENILLSAEKGVLQLSTSNLETAIRTGVGAKVVESGATSIPARVFVSLIANLPPGKLELVVVKDILTVTAKGFSSRVNGLPAKEFPTIAEEGKRLFVIPAKALREGIGQVSFVAAQDESRPILTGLLLRLTGGKLILTGVDGFRLAEKKLALSKAGSASGGEAKEEDLSVVIPARALTEVARLIEGEVEVSSPGEGQLLFRTPDYLVFTQAIEGEFPDYEQIIPANFETKINFAKDELQQAVQLTSVFSEKGTNVVGLKYDPQKKSLEITSSEEELGEAQISLPISGEGKGGTISFNSRYLTEALNALPGEEVELSLNSALDPALFTAPKEKSYLHVVMPVRLQG